MRHGAKIKKCSSEGCTTYAQKGRVCIRHGAKVKLCSLEGCANNVVVVKGGVCKRHGAKVKHKLCSSDGCTNNPQQGGVCIRHGAKVTQCSSEGCTNQAVRQGVCIKHGAKKAKRCSGEGCTNLCKMQRSNHVAAKDAQIMLSKEGCVGGTVQTKDYVAVKVGMEQRSKVKRCSSGGCTNQAQNGGVCRRHGAKIKVKNAAVKDAPIKPCVEESVGGMVQNALFTTRPLLSDQNSRRLPQL